MKKRIYILALLSLLIMTGCSNKLTKNNLEAYLIENKFEEISLGQNTELDLFENIEGLDYRKKDLFLSYSYSEDGAILKFYNENIVDRLIDEDKNIIDEAIDESGNIRIDYEEGLKSYRLETYQKDDTYLIFNYLINKINQDQVDEIKERYDLEAGNFEKIVDEEARDYGLAIRLEKILADYKLENYHISEDRIEVLSDYYMKKDFHRLIKNKSLFIKSLAEIPLGNNLNKDYDLTSINYMVINLEGTNILIDKSGLAVEDRENLVNDCRSELTEVLTMDRLDYYNYILKDQPKNEKIGKPDLIVKVEGLEKEASKNYRDFIASLKELTIEDLKLESYIDFDDRLNFKNLSLSKDGEKFKLNLAYEFVDYEKFMDKLFARLKKEMKKEEEEEINLELLLLTEIKALDKDYLLVEEKLGEDKTSLDNPFISSLNKIKEGLGQVEKTKKEEDKAREKRRLEKDSKEKTTYMEFEGDQIIDFNLDEEIIFNKTFDYDLDGQMETLVISQVDGKTNIYLKEEEHLNLYETISQGIEDISFYQAQQKDRTYGLIVVNTSNYTRWSEKAYVYTLKDGKIHRVKLPKDNVNIQLEEDKLLAKEWKMGNILLGEVHKKKVYELNFNGLTGDFDLINEYVENE